MSWYVLVFYVAVEGVQEGVGLLVEDLDVLLDQLELWDILDIHQVWMLFLLFEICLTIEVLGLDINEVVLRTVSDQQQITREKLIFLYSDNLSYKEILCSSFYETRLSEHLDISVILFTITSMPLEILNKVLDHANEDDN